MLKKVREVAFYVSRKCRFVRASDWIEIGIGLVKKITQKRDFLLPRPMSDLKAAGRTMMVYSDMVAMSRHLSAELAKPIWKNDRWVSGGEQLLKSPGHLFHTEHSERHFLVSVGAAIGIPKEDRDMCGTWGIMQAQSHDYMHTAREVTLRVQEAVFQDLQNPDCRYDEEELREKYLVFLKQRGVDDLTAETMVKVTEFDFAKDVSNTVVIDPAPLELLEEDDDDCFGPAEEFASLDDAMNSVEKDKSEELDQASVLPQKDQYWATVSRSGFRCLHRMGSIRCHVDPSKVFRWEICTESSTKSDKACSWCFGDRERSDNVSSSGSSDSEADTSDSDSPAVEF
jgi:hypothetical protein